uniref:Si:ch73-54f23.4 n=1 Tax=Acanthochromis polyacanthus TaxID=80966 RepID=A0A3Q1EKJ2_9TELE
MVPSIIQSFVFPALSKQVSCQLCSSSGGGYRGPLRSVYITSVTFDPETAHPNLSLSQSCDSVWFDEDKDTEDCQANPRRFNYYYCVFGHQCFTSGRHYWEVEVGNKTAWRLGVAQENVPRGQMAATGTSSGLWTLALKGGSVQACTDPQPTKVNVSLRLVRIGVFLDCEKEEVTFYNAVTMAPIYTFSMGTVVVPLFPFFNPCDTDDGNNIAPVTGRLCRPLVRHR